MRSAIQANRGQARILQGLPAETPETPVLIFKKFIHFSKVFSFSFRQSFLTTCAVHGDFYILLSHTGAFCGARRSIHGQVTLPCVPQGAVTPKSMQIFSPFMTTRSFSTDAPVISLSRFLLTLLFEKVLPEDAINSGSFSCPPKIRQ